MNFVANAAITAAIINAVLAGFVLYTNPRSTLNRVYAMWGGSVSIWNFAAFFKSFSSVQEQQATILVGIIQGAVIFFRSRWRIYASSLSTAAPRGGSTHFTRSISDCSPA